MKPSRYVIVEKACCGTCAHYHQHYVLGKGARSRHCGTATAMRPA